jgi:hypothetical protein
MDVTRRGFLAAAGAAPLGPAFASWPRCATSLCALPESRAGWDAALAGSTRWHLVVLPAAVGWDDSLLWRVRSGATVIFESAAGFGDARAFAEQRTGLRSAFGLTIDEPTSLWKAAPSPGYLDLRWPLAAKVRDFSSVVGVQGGETVGRLGPRPVAALQRRGAGAFLFLGSPVGPALWSRDPQAQAWLASVQTLGRDATS